VSEIRKKDQFPTLLDCTLRDGGYYNNWDFPLEVVNDYLNAMVKAGIDVVEIGFRGLKQNQFYGAHAFSTENYLKQLDLPKEITLAIMLNASDLLRLDDNLKNEIKRTFCSASNSRVSLVRVACHYPEYEKVFDAVIALKELGYSVGINLMQIASRSESEIKKFVIDIKNWPLKVIYVADSTGSLNPQQTAKIIKVIKDHWGGEIGVHMHDNMGLAIQNCVEAVRNGASFVDSTVTGMGRGPGNAQTEFVISEQNLSGKGKINPIPLLKLINRYFKSMREVCGWGQNYYYKLAGQLQIHPSYIQDMLEDNRYGEEEIIEAIEVLKTNGKKYSSEILAEALAQNFDNNIGSWSPYPELKGKSVLIIGSGQSVKKYRLALESFIKLEKPFVIAINSEQSIDRSLIDIYAACNVKRIISDISSYHKLEKRIVLPLSSIKKNINDEIDTNQFLDYGLDLKKNTFKFRRTSATIPAPLGLAYALAIANSGGSNKIFLAGNDGYNLGDQRNFDIEKIFDAYKKSEGATEVISITPTLFKLRLKSLYSF